MRWLLYILVLCVSVANSATYYVDYVGGADANAGTSTGAAFKHCPGDQQAASTAGSTTLSAGDSVIFKGGVTYILEATNATFSTPKAAIALSWSGTAGNPITYDGNSAGTWGTGKATLTDNHGTNNLVAFYGSVARSNLTFRNFIIQEIGGSTTPPTDLGVPVAANPGRGIDIETKAENILVSDCEFYELGYYWNVKPMEEASLLGVGVGFIDARGCTITNCDFKKMGWGIYNKSLSLTTNFTISNCRLSESIKWRIDLNMSPGAAVGGLTITNCDLFNCGEFGDGTWLGYGAWPHMDGIFLRSDYSDLTYCTNADWTGINFVANRFWDTNQIGANGTAVIYLAGGTSANIWNNTFVHTVKTRSIFIAGARGAPHTPQTVRIYGNTFLMNHEKAIGVSQTIPMYLLDVRNNIFRDISVAGDQTTVYIEQAACATNLTWDYNIYKCDNVSGDYWNWATVFTGPLASAQANGLEAHGLASSPVFVNETYGTGASCNLNDLRLQVSSPAIGTGVVLGGIFGVDKNGVTRGAAVDMGAYEYVAPAGNTGSVTTLNLGTVTFGP